MEYKFRAYGHENITSKHKNTFEFTKDSFVTKTGDCIVGVKADFSLKEIKKFIKSLKSDKIKIIISVDGIIEEINAEINKDFNSEHEIVIRKSDFLSERTLAIRADKSAINFKKEIIEKFCQENVTIYITLHKYGQTEDLLS